MTTLSEKEAKQKDNKASKVPSWCTHIEKFFSTEENKQAKTKAEQMDCHGYPYLYHTTGYEGMVKLLRGDNIETELFTSRIPIAFYAEEESKQKVILKIRPNKNKICQFDTRQIKDTEVLSTNGDVIYPLNEQLISCKRIESMKKCQKCNFEFSKTNYHPVQDEQEVILSPKHNIWKLDKNEIESIMPSYYSDYPQKTPPTKKSDIEKILISNGLREFISKIKTERQYCPKSKLPIDNYEEFLTKC